MWGSWPSGDNTSVTSSNSWRHSPPPPHRGSLSTVWWPRQKYIQLRISAEVYIDGNCQDKRQEHLLVTPMLINVWERDSQWGANNGCFAAISSWFPIFLIFISCLLQTPRPVCGSWRGPVITSNQCTVYTQDHFLSESFVTALTALTSCHWQCCYNKYHQTFVACL